eukprot:4137112-Amphidinium_carterae.2
MSFANPENIASTRKRTTWIQVQGRHDKPPNLLTVLLPLSRLTGVARDRASQAREMCGACHQREATSSACSIRALYLKFRVLVVILNEADQKRWNPVSA